MDKLKERLESLMEVIEKRMFSDDDVERCTYHSVHVKRSLACGSECTNHSLVS